LRLWPAFILLLTAALTPQLSERLVIGAFPEAVPGNAYPEAWESLRFGNRTAETEYRVVEKDGIRVIRADSRNAASGMFREIDVDLREYPVIEWRWRIEQVLEKGDVRRRSGDDYPARIYITFDYDPANLSFTDRLKYRGLRALGYRDIPLRALNYIWANKAPVGTVVANPFTDWVMMIAVDSGNAKAGQWVSHRRNILQDYRAAFGEDPPPITGIAIMTDTDNTGETAVAYYGDIVLRRDFQ
jgi:hypothetical protein